MMKLSFRRPWSRVVLAAMLGVALVVGCAGMSARAEDDDDNALPDTKFFRSVLKALGLRQDGEGIDYRERSPLVIPPGHDLPPPQTDNPAAKVAGWPDDPDVKRAKLLKAERNKPNKNPEEERPLLPSEYNVKASPSPISRPDGTERSAEQTSRPMSPFELGAKNPLSSLWAPKEEYSTFTGEPARTSLIDPPPGYRTPSPNQPYGIGKQEWKEKPADRLEPVK